MKGYTVIYNEENKVRKKYFRYAMQMYRWLDSNEGNNITLVKIIDHVKEGSEIKEIIGV